MIDMPVGQQCNSLWWEFIASNPISDSQRLQIYSVWLDLHPSRQKDSKSCLQPWMKMPKRAEQLCQNKPSGNNGKIPLEKPLFLPKDLELVIRSSINHLNSIILIREGFFRGRKRLRQLKILRVDLPVDSIKCQRMRCKKKTKQC